MSDGPFCAHLQISWRTESCDGINVRGEVTPGSATRGWWECNSDCGAKFWPIASPVPLPATEPSPEAIEAAQQAFRQDWPFEISPFTAPHVAAAVRAAYAVDSAPLPLREPTEVIPVGEG